MRLLFAAFLFVVGLFGTLADDRQVLEVFVISHSHDDVGWIKTFQKYYDDQVRSIYNTVIDALDAHPHRIFNAVEMAFFEKWWMEQNSTRRATTRRLIQNGQLNFILGGWVMQDEAISHYAADIHQMAEGHHFLLETFGPSAIPRIGWHCDPFGQSSVTPTMFTDMCFDSHAFMRLVTPLNNHLKSSRGLQFSWQSSPTHKDSTNMMTHILESHYSSPEGFDFECEPKDRWHNPFITDQNIRERANVWARDMRRREQMFRTPNLLVPFGSDFKFVNAHLMYGNMDKLMKFINDNFDTYRLNMRYATLDTYFQALRASQLAQKMEFPMQKQRDFLPYGDAEDQWWTGFYTSRPALKGFTRYADHLIRVAEQLTVMSHARFAFHDASKGTIPDYRKLVLSHLRVLRRNNAVIQHHDAVTGTAKVHVYDDYMRLLTEGVQAVQPVMDEMMNSMMNVEGGQNVKVNVSHDPVPVLKTFLAAPSREKELLVSLYNSLGWVSHEYHRMAIQTNKVIVKDAQGNIIPYQINQRLRLSYLYTNIDPYKINYPVTDYPYELIFPVTIPPLGFATYYVVPCEECGNDDSGAWETMKAVDSVPAGSSEPSFFIENDYYRLFFSNRTGSFVSLVNKLVNNGKSVPFTQQFMSYRASRKEGAYIFQPLGQASPIPKTNADFVAYVRRGPLVQEVVCHLTQELTMVTRLYMSEGHKERAASIEVRHHIGPITLNSDLITRYSFASSLPNRRVLYQDDNGLESWRREYDTRLSSPIAGNYFPMVSGAYILDEAAASKGDQDAMQFSVSSRRSHGVSTQKEGDFEVCLHRNAQQDDGEGMFEAMDDRTRIEVVLHLQYDRHSTSRSARRVTSQRLNYPLMPFYGICGAPGTPQCRASQSYASSLQALSAPLPPQVHLLSLQLNIASNSDYRLSQAEPVLLSDHVVVRFVNLYGVDPAFSSSSPPPTTHMIDGTLFNPMEEVVLPWNSLFAPWLKPSGMLETTLTGVKARGSCRRTNWSSLQANATTGLVLSPNNAILVRPLSFATFSLQLQDVHIVPSIPKPSAGPYSDPAIVKDSIADSYAQDSYPNANVKDSDVESTVKDAHVGDIVADSGADVNANVNAAAADTMSDHEKPLTVMLIVVCGMFLMLMALAVWQMYTCTKRRRLAGYWASNRNGSAREQFIPSSLHIADEEDDEGHLEKGVRVHSRSQLKNPKRFPDLEIGVEEVRDKKV